MHRSSRSSTRGARRPGLLLTALVLGVGVLGACGDDGDGDDTAAPAENGESAEDVAAGEDLYQQRGCAACHDGGVAPDLEGLYMEDVELEDGSTVTADDEYLERSIRDPGAEIVAGYGTSMPDVSLSDEEIEQLVAYIRDLGS